MLCLPLVCDDVTMNRLSPEELSALTDTLPTWSVEGPCLLRTYTFANFIEAFSFMTKVALIAQAKNHHPDWENHYNVVTIRLTTHSEGGITLRDAEVARAIEATAGTSTP